MDDVQRILVVDDGERKIDNALSAELAEMGFGSVTASIDAAEEVLSLISNISAIVLQIPRDADTQRREKFDALAGRLRRSAGSCAPPVIMMEGGRWPRRGSVASLLGGATRMSAVARPDRS